MSPLHVLDACMAGLLSFAAIHYGIQAWYSRKERILLVFTIQCAFYTGLAVAMVARDAATTIAESQRALDLNITFGVLGNATSLHLYALLSNRRDRLFRVLTTGTFLVLVLLNQWAPIRGTVLDLRLTPLPGGGEGLLPVRTPAGASLIVLYLASVATNVYAFVAAYTMWRRNRVGAFWIALAATGTSGATVLAVLIDFAHLQAPYIGALPVGFFVLCMALILAREYSARAARESVANRHFQTVFEHSPIGKALFATSGEVLQVNRALCRILGATAEELSTRRLQDFTNLDEVESRLLAGELPIHSVEQCFIRTDGQPVWVLLAISVVPNDHGRPVRIIAQLQDVTELRTHRETLEKLIARRTLELRNAKDDADRANAAKSRFLAYMSHEIRNSLGVIMLHAQLLQHDDDLGEPQQRKGDAIFSSGKHLLTLLNEVLEISKIEAGHAELIEDEFDLAAALDELVQMFAVQSARKGIALTIDPTTKLPRSLLADGGKVRQILINLVNNAIKFTHHGTIRIHASARAIAEDAILVTIAVADTGIGIATPDLQRMFLPFEQLEPGARAGGTGLGLAISLTHARLMQGDLTATSTPNVGTTFTLTFLAKRLQPQPAVIELPPPAALPPPCKVLIVDDDERNRDLLAAMLSKTSIETRTAAGGHAALAVTAAWVPDLVLMDLRMPDMGGLETIRRMKAAGSKVAIGVISASTLPRDEREAITFGADFFMRKPYDEHKLVERIANIMRTRA